LSIGRALRMSSERRSAKRVPVNHVFMHGRALAGSLEVDARVDLVCLDVSETGCLALDGRRHLVEGDLVRLLLSPSTGAERGITARVVRTGEDVRGRAVAAFVFEHVSSVDRARILDWHAWWSRQGSAPPPTRRRSTDARTDALNEAIAAARRAFEDTRS
jgi:hypothetical protein